MAHIFETTLKFKNEKAYFLQSIIDENLLRTEEDDALIQELQSQNVEYVEF